MNLGNSCLKNAWQHNCQDQKYFSMWKWVAGWADQVVGIKMKHTIWLKHMKRMDQTMLDTNIKHKTYYTEWNKIWTWNRYKSQEIWWWNKSNREVQLTSTYSTLAAWEGAFLSTRHSNTSTLADVTVPLIILARDFLFSLPSTITGAASSLSERTGFRQHTAVLHHNQTVQVIFTNFFLR
jgi:hypothetical protein